MCQTPGRSANRNIPMCSSVSSCRGRAYLKMRCAQRYETGGASCARCDDWFRARARMRQTARAEKETRVQGSVEGTNEFRFCLFRLAAAQGIPQNAARAAL
jgi:hypothetical protein